MKSKRSLMLMLVGLAMLATPLTAAAKDHHGFEHNNSGAQREFRNGRNSWAPAAVVRHDEWRENHGWNHGWSGRDRDADDYRNYGYGNGGYGYGNGGYGYGRRYGNGGYYSAPVYDAPAYGYGGGYGGYGNCRRAQSIVNNYYRDRGTGHPAAANDILRQNQWAFRSGCAGSAPIGGGLFGGYNGYNRGYYGNGYNGGYGQSYGGSSILAPLLQYVR
ncbi:MAG TPA: hypothetical protein VE243_02535 [Candidatus Acidoferrum sp.]|nr:hypothetical protein [Candidatus Acidoferrum sp.]